MYVLMMIETNKLDCTALHCTALHCTALHCTALHCTALHCTDMNNFMESTDVLCYMHTHTNKYTVCINVFWMSNIYLYEIHRFVRQSTRLMVLNARVSCQMHEIWRSSLVLTNSPSGQHSFSMESNSQAIRLYITNSREGNLKKEFKIRQYGLGINIVPVCR